MEILGRRGGGLCEIPSMVGDGYFLELHNANFSILFSYFYIPTFISSPYISVFNSLFPMLSFQLSVCQFRFFGIRLELPCNKGSCREIPCAIHSIKISGLRLKNSSVSNGSWRVRALSFHSTRKTLKTSSLVKVFWQFFRVFSWDGFNFCLIAMFYS